MDRPNTKKDYVLATTKIGP